MSDTPPETTRLERALFDTLMQMLEAQSHQIAAQRAQIEDLQRDVADLRSWVQQWREVIDLAMPSSSPDSPKD